MNGCSDESPWMVVTGASSGIGRAAALAIAAVGNHRVLAVGRHARRLEELVHHASPAERIVPVVADVAEPEGRQRVADVVADTAVAGLLHIAGFMPLQRLEEMPHDVWEKLFATHVHARLYLTRDLLPNLAAGARVLLIGSRSATTVRKGAAGYCSSYAASMMLGECLRVELSPREIAVVNVIPGGVDTPLLRHSIAADPSVFPDQKCYEADLHEGRLLDPAVVGQFFRWLATQAEHEWLMQQSVVSVFDQPLQTRWWAGTPLVG